MSFVQEAILAVAKHHHHSNDTTGHTPIPEIPHHEGLEKIGKLGHTTLWVVFAIMSISTVIFFLAQLRIPAQKALFHRITMLITLTAAISYYFMASGSGKTYVRAPSGDNHKALREVFWARDVDWLITTPLLLLDLALVAGLAPINVIQLMVADVAMILLGLFAGLDKGFQSRFVPYGLSCAAFLYIVFVLFVQGRASANARSDSVGSIFTTISVFSMALWTAYPVVWALCEGTNYLSSDVEVVCYAVLDVLAKAVFGFMLLIAHARTEELNVDMPSFLVEPVGTRGGYGAISSADD